MNWHPYTKHYAWICKDRVPIHLFCTLLWNKHAQNHPNLIRNDWFMLINNSLIIKNTLTLKIVFDFIFNNPCCNVVSNAVTGCCFSALTNQVLSKLQLYKAINWKASKIIVPRFTMFVACDSTGFVRAEEQQTEYGGRLPQKWHVMMMEMHNSFSSILAKILTNLGMKPKHML